jgi:hypothetical protein
MLGGVGAGGLRPPATRLGIINQFEEPSISMDESIAPSQ